MNRMKMIMHMKRMFIGGPLFPAALSHSANGSGLLRDFKLDGPRKVDQGQNAGDAIRPSLKMKPWFNEIQGARANFRHGLRAEIVRIG